MDDPTMKNAQSFIDERPHTVFKKAQDYGCLFYYKFSPCPPGELREVVIKALKEGIEVGSSEFVEDLNFGGSPTTAHVQNVEVHEDHTRKGIATSLYVLAERLLEVPLQNEWEGDIKQKPPAVKLWAQPDRPFGPQ